MIIVIILTVDKVLFVGTRRQFGKHFRQYYACLYNDDGVELLFRRNCSIVTPSPPGVT